MPPLEIDESQKDYTKSIQLVKEKGLEKNQRTPTPEVAEKTRDEADYTWDSWRYYMIPGILDYLHKEDEVVRDKVHEGGEATHYWRLKK